MKTNDPKRSFSMGTSANVLKCDTCKFHTRMMSSIFSPLEFLDRNLDKNFVKNFNIFYSQRLFKILTKVSKVSRGNKNLQENPKSWQEFQDILDWVQKIKELKGRWIFGI